MRRDFTFGIDRNRVLLAMTLLALSVAVGPAAAPNGNAARPTPPTRLLLVGGLLDISSGWTSLGKASRVTLDLAAADANARLAREGSPLRVQVRTVDLGGKPSVAVRRLRRLAAQGIRVFVGPESSAEVRAVRAAANRLGVLVVSQGSTAHSLALAGDNVFRLVPDDRREAEAMAALLKRDRIRAIAPIWRNDPGNAGLVKSLRARFKGVMSAGVPYAVDTTSFSAEVAALGRQVGALRARKLGAVGVYLAGFDEVVDLFQAASADPALGAVRWYGSDGVALTTRLVGNATAAAFANASGYPNPTLGLDAKATRRSAALRARIRARLGSRPDAFALTTYDALQIAVRAAERTGGIVRIGQFRRVFTKAAHGYQGVTGTIVLNAAGDRAYGSYDFWSVCRSRSAFAWQRTFSYLASGVGRGHIVRRAACRRGS
jgi:branched-chain amino acid transport system substrate-binding protein